MKRINLLLAGMFFALLTQAQTDTSGKKEKDTIQIGNMVIIKDGDERNSAKEDIKVIKRFHDSKKKVSTSFFTLDLGFSNYSDNSNYTQLLQNGIVGSGINEQTMDLRTGKSVNVNIWFFMQRRSLIKNAVNLKYGLGLELNNYRYTAPVKFQKNQFPMVRTMDSTASKNKLAVDYVTVPLMLNFNLTPGRKHNFGFSAGASIGYRYASRQKFKGGDFGKEKDKGNFDLNPWKLSYIGELNLGYITLYGSYATESMFKNGPDLTPYNIGIRLGKL